MEVRRTGIPKKLSGAKVAPSNMGRGNGRLVAPTKLDLEKVDSELFRGLSDVNPLKKLNSADRRLLLCFTGLFEMSGRYPLRSARLQRYDDVAKTARQAAELAEKIASIIGKDWDPILRRRLMRHRELPGQLKSFLVDVGGLLFPFGNMFARQKVISDKNLVRACLLIKRKTGKWNDEHLTDLLNRLSPVEGRYDGGAIARMRTRFKSDYPVIYQALVEKVSRGDYEADAEEAMSGR